MPDTPPPPSTRDQHYQIASRLIDLGFTGRAARLAEISRRAGRDIPAFAALTRDEAQDVIDGLRGAPHAGVRAISGALDRLRADGWAL
jgi:hypothetical protein